MYVNARFHNRGFLGANAAVVVAPRKTVAVLPSAPLRVAVAPASVVANAPPVRTPITAAPVAPSVKTLRPDSPVVATQVKAVRVGDMTIAPLSTQSTNGPVPARGAGPAQIRQTAPDSSAANVPSANAPSAPTLVKPVSTVRVGDMTISPVAPPAPLGPPAYTNGSGDAGGDGGDLGPLAPPEAPAASDEPAADTYSLAPGDGGGDGSGGGEEAKVDSGTTAAAPTSRAWLWWILAIAAGSVVIYVVGRKPKGALQGLQNDRVRGAKLVMPDLRSGRLLAWWPGAHEALVVDRDGQVIDRVPAGDTIVEARRHMARYLREGR